MDRMDNDDIENENQVNEANAEDEEDQKWIICFDYKSEKIRRIFSFFQILNRKKNISFIFH